ncbi:hypothetical protein GGR92_005033 [Spirosoma lacussanchae]|uniref:S41 family peptidase n=1 Tax=Spirosoma lacussanchae TaxID=1884249 RepID=UPI001109173E|nr:S41 family peptidase [Spirosoma lacussanchae]
MKYFFTLTFSLLVTSSLWAQKIAKSQALEDLTFLERILVNGHPVNYNPAHPKVTLLPLLQKLKANQQDSLTSTQFQRLLREAIFRMGCVHTRISKVPTEPGKTNKVFFPSSLWIRNGILVDTLNRAVQAINGIAAQQLVDEIRHLYASDGATTALSTAVFNKNSSWLVSQYLNYPAQYTMRLDTTTLLLQAVSSPPSVPHTSSSSADQVLFRNEDNVFYLTSSVPVLKLTEFRKNDRALIKKSFRYLEQTPAKQLILDLRDNLGGNRQSAVALTQHLLKDVAFSYTILQPKPSIWQYLNGKGKLYLALSKLKYNVGQFYRGQKTALGRAFVYRYRPSKHPFEGQVYVLTDGYTASASTMVTSWLKQHSSARFVGQQSGGGYNGNNGGSFPTVTLPNTKYEISTPAYRLILDAGSSQAQGIMPDVIIEPDGAKDAALKRTIELIGAGGE